MADSSETQRYHTHFHREQLVTGEYKLARRHDAPPVMSDPTGRLLKIATIDAGATAICPSCASTGRGAFLSFVQDLRMAYACPSCASVVWLSGA